MSPSGSAADSVASPHILIVHGAGIAGQLAQTALGAAYDVYDWASPPPLALCAHRTLELWGPDSSVAQVAAAHYLPTAASVALIDSEDDFGKALLKADWEGQTIREYMEEHRVAFVQDPPKPPAAPTTKAKKGGARLTGNGHAPIEAHHEPLKDGLLTWHELALHCNSAGKPDLSIENAAILLSQHPGFAARMWFDDFRGTIMLASEQTTRPWTDADDLNANSFLTNTVGLPFSLQTTVHAIHLIAFRHRRNSVTDWLDTLEWDNTERLNCWTSDFLGCANTPYTQAVGSNWLISMVARAYRPGCQCDHMPVLEGPQGRGKSSALAILGGEYYRAAPQAFGSKEFFEVIQGAWLIEIPDMVGFGRREHSQIISAITTRSDSYRASYGRHVQEHPRTVIFAATSETNEYLQDSRGIRRYWPLECNDINLPALACAREQLFAEAVAAFKRGASWHEVPHEAATVEQEKRREVDVWVTPIESYLFGKSTALVSDVLENCLRIEVARINRADQMRVSNCLKLLGFTKDKRKRLNGKPEWPYSR
jgi:hypothetical protein